MAALVVTFSTWEEQVLKSNLPVAVDFWAPWCPYCRQLMPIFEELSKEYEGRMSFVKLNVDEEPVIASRYGIMGIPALKFFCEGRPIGEVVGYMPRERLKAELERVLSVHKECLAGSSRRHQVHG